MTTVFVDTAYWIAIVRRDDQWNEAARAARAQLGSSQLVTTDEVLTEFLTSLSSAGPHMRVEAEGITEILTSDHNFEQEGFTILMKRNRS